MEHRLQGKKVVMDPGTLRREGRGPRFALRAAPALPVSLLPGKSFAAGPGLLLLLLGLWPAAASAGGHPVPAESAEQEVLEHANATRRAQQLAALEEDAGLARLAREHACDMARGQFVSHVSPSAGGLAERLRRAGRSFARVAENIAAAQGDDPAARAVQGWLRSPPHRQNLLSSAFTQTGVGVCRLGRTYYVTQVFIRPL